MRFLSNSIWLYIKVYAKNSPSLYNVNGFYGENCLYREPLHTNCRSRIVWDIRPIRAQLAHPFVTYLYKKGTVTPPALPTIAPPSLLCLVASKMIGPARSNDGEDRSSSAPPLGGKCIFVIWTPMLILMEDGWPPDIVHSTRAMTRTGVVASAAISQFVLYCRC
jgi:hypothetical protein